jgi:hypothetical protein
MSDVNPAPADLEALRDQKCEPVVRGMLNDLAKDLIPPDANEKIDYNPVILALQQRALDADLNITTEVSYVFQLITGVLQGLSATVQTCTFVPPDDVKYGRIAKQILLILAGATSVDVLDSKAENIEKNFAAVKPQIDQLFMQEKLSMLEIKYIMDNVFDAYNDVESAFMQLLKQHGDQASAKLFGVESLVDLSLKKLDEVLKS